MSDVRGQDSKLQLISAAELAWILWFGATYPDHFMFLLVVIAADSMTADARTEREDQELCARSGQDTYQCSTGMVWNVKAG
jgi:hypothetical protein